MDRLTHRTRPITDRERQAAAETIETSLATFDRLAADARSRIAAGGVPHMETTAGSATAGQATTFRLYVEIACGGGAPGPV